MAKAKQFVFLLLSPFFLTAGLIAGLYFDSPPSAKELAVQVSKSVRREIESARNEASRLQKLPVGSPSWQNAENSFFLVDSLKVLEWTRHDFLPDLRLVQETFSLKLLQVAQGSFLVRKWPVHGSQFLLLVLPLQKDFKIVNNYLSPEWNASIFPAHVQIVDPTGEGEAINLEDGRCIFKIRKPVGQPDENTLNLVGLLSITLSIISFLIFAVTVLRRWHGQGKQGVTFLGLATCLLGLRIAMVKLNIPNTFSDFLLFDPHRFASSSFNASMGDLLLNALVILFLCTYLFLNYPTFEFVKKLLAAKPSYKLLTSTTCLVVCFLALVYPYLFIEIIYHNSSITLEITDSVLFDGIRWVAFLSLLIGCISSFLFIHIFFRLALLYTRRQRNNFWIALAGAGLIFLAFFLITQKSYWITLGVGLVYFSILFVGKITHRFSMFTFRTFLYFLIVIVALAFQGALSLKKFNEERRIQDQFRFGNNFLVGQDVLGEYLLNESAQRIAKDPFIHSRFLPPFLSKNSIRQKVRQFYLSTYFDRYDIRVYLYNSSGEPDDNQAAPDLATSIKNYQDGAHKTTYAGIYFINNPTSEATKQYLVIIPVKRIQATLGFVVLNLTLKKVIPRNVYPELLVDNRFSHYLKSKDFSYALYTNGRLSNSFGEFNYETDFDQHMLGDASLYRKGISENGFYHVGLEDQDVHSAIVSAKVYPLFFLITNFSYLFVLGLMVVLLVLVSRGIEAWMTNSRLNYSARIQLYVYLAFFLPLLTVSITTLSLTNRSAEEQLRMEYEDRSRILGEKIAGPLEDFQKDPANYRGENQIAELARVANLDASVYGTDGELIVSTQPLIFENQLISTLINRRAWQAIINEKETSYVTGEKIGRLGYNCSYVAVKSPETGEQLGILSIPFFASAQSLEKIQINVLANILTVFVLVFILFSALSFLMANGLTFPLRFITKSIKKTTLTDRNQPIRWNSNDEIGLLANEYNRMIKNLEQSRIELARIQKETAWREIAKQVAHEIKNPLTPMKLTLQQMERSLNSGSLDEEKSRKSVETLLKQVEILNEIATSFSTFARMPAPVLTRIDLKALLTNVVGLHQTYPEGTISLELDTKPVFVLGNDQLMGRVLGNILLNALQSGKDGKKVTVKVWVELQEKTCRLCIQDDGLGIDADIREKVFLPQFSTKRAGSGLGLAIAKQGIEQCGGKVWFESNPGGGTTFFIELILVDF